MTKGRAAFGVGLAVWQKLVDIVPTGWYGIHTDWWVRYGKDQIGDF